jgi:hypothetical protein
VDWGRCWCWRSDPISSNQPFWSCNVDFLWAVSGYDGGQVQHEESPLIHPSPIQPMPSVRMDWRRLLQRRPSGHAACHLVLAYRCKCPRVCSAFSAIHQTPRAWSLFPVEAPNVGSVKWRATH